MDTTVSNARRLTLLRIIVFKIKLVINIMIIFITNYYYVSKMAKDFVIAC